MDENRGIGRENRLPWRQSADLKRFKSLTMGHHIIMGRKTFESIGQPLPGRVMVVVTRNPAFQLKGCDPASCFVVHSLKEALDLAAARGEAEAFVIGGGDIFAQAIDLADRIYLTRVHTTGPVDVYFPEFTEQDWIPVESSQYPADQNNQFQLTFTLFEKKLPNH
jgi:dihydrofolate reductase